MSVLSKSACVLGVLSVVGAPATSTATPAAAGPVMKDGVVSCLNKEVEYQPDRGRFRITADGDLLAQSSVSFHFVDKRTGEERYLENGGMSPGLWRVEKGFTNGVYSYSGYLDLKDCSYRHWTCTFELMPDGLIRYTEQGFPCPRPDLYTVRCDSLFIGVPKSVGPDCTIATNGVIVARDRLGPRGLKSRWGEKDMSFSFFAGDPARQIDFLLPEGHGVGVRTVEPRGDGSLHSYINSERGQKKTIYIDIRKGVPKSISPHVRGGIDLMKVEKIVPPDDSGKNLLPNGSFECGLKGWFHRAWAIGGDWWAPGRWETLWYETVPENAKFGTRSLKCHADFDPNGNKWDPRRLRNAYHIGSMPILLGKGTHTLSFWAKAADDKTYGYVWCPVFGWAENGHMTTYTHRSKAARKFFCLGKEWQKVSFTFEQKKADAFYLMMNYHNRTKASTVWVDGFQLEKGSVATHFESPVAEAELITSEKANFIDASQRVDARLRLVTAPNAKGEVRVRAKLPEGRELFDRTFSFTADAAGEATVRPDFENFGNGLFVLRYDFTVNGKTHYQHDRFTRTPYTTGRDFKWKKLFASDYSDQSFRPDALRLFDRYVKCGIGSADDITECPNGRALYRKYGIEPGLQCMATDTYHCGGAKSNEVSGIMIGEHNLKLHAKCPYWPGRTPGTELLIAQNTIEGVPLDAAYLARFKEAVKERVRRHMDVIWWEFCSELPVSVWCEKADPAARAAAYAQYLKAFAEGVHEANPKALALTESPCNLSQSGIQEICDALTELHRIGGRVDGVSAHPYRYAPENPDLEQSILEVMNCMRKLGYPEDAPLTFGEMMHWGPYEIPGLGTESSTWGGTPRTWSGGTLSYDLGTTERRSAAWRARSWLVGLKYAHRILCMVGGNGNNWEVDALQTPRLTQLVSATLCNLLGNSTFKADVRFAPFVRAFAFEDEKGRPVVATWCHKEAVDFEREAAPEAVAPFGDDLEGFFDISGHFTPVSELKVKDGKVRFALPGCPKYWRFRPGSTDRVVAALRKARVVSGVGISPIRLSAKPVAPDRVAVTVSNFLSDDFPVTLADGAGQKTDVTVPASGKTSVEWPMPPLKDGALVATPLKVTATAKEGGKYDFDLSCSSHLVKRVPDQVDETTVDWTKVPAIPLANRVLKPRAGFAAQVRYAWNAKGLLVRVEVKDATFSHREHAEGGRRWDNDCLQLYLDTFLTARSGVASCNDDDDYEYAVFPNAAGTSARVWRMRGADQQLTVGVTKVKRDSAWCDTSRAHFAKTADGYVYTVLLSEEDIMPLRLEKGQAFGLGVQAVDANDDKRDFHSQQSPKGRVDGMLNDATDGKSFYNKPALLPAALLWD